MNLRHWLRLSLVLASWALMPAGAAGAAELTEPLPVDPELTVGRLENGLTYYVRANRQPAGHAVLYLVVHAGSIVEDDDQRGLAHFVEHMAFNGTRHYKGRELVDFLRSLGMSVGAHVNAGTDFDETVYQLVVPTGDAAVFGRALQVLEEWAHGIAFEPAEVDQERGVVLAEWRQSRGATSRIRDRLIPTLFKSSRYARRLPEGQREVIESATADDLKRFYRDWYRPDLMAVVAVGDFEPRQVEELIRGHLGQLAPPARPRPREDHPIPDNEPTLVNVATDPEATQTEVTVFLKREHSPLRTVGDYRELLLESLFVQMMNARLVELLLEPSPPFLAAGAEVGSFTRTDDYGALSLLAKQGEVAPGLEALMSEVERVRRHGFTSTELDRVRCQMLKVSENARQEHDKLDSAGFAQLYARHFSGRGVTHNVEIENRLDRELLPAVRVEEVNRLTGRWSGERNRAVLVMAPVASAATLPTEGALLGVLARVGTEPLEPYRDVTSSRPLLAAEPRGAKVVSQRRIEALGVTEWTLGNGVKVVLKPTDFQNDAIYFTAFSPGGLSLVPPEDAGSAAVAVEVVVRSGFGDLSTAELTKKLACYQSDAIPFIGPFEEGIQGVAAPDELEVVFRVIHLMLTSPRAEAHALEATREKYAELVRHWSPEEEFGQMIAEVMTQGDPRFRRPTERDVASLSLEKALAFYDDRFRDLGDLTFIMVGNLPLERIRPLAETYLGGLPSQGRKEPWKDPDLHPLRGEVRRELRQRLAEKSSVQLWLTGPLRWTPDEEVLLGAVSHVLQARLEERLRERRSATYGVAVNAGCFTEACYRAASGDFQVIVGFECDPAQVDDLVQEVRGVMAELKAGGVKDGEIADVRKAWKDSLEIGLKDNGFWLGALARYYSLGEQAVDFERLRRSIDALTPNSVREAAMKYLDTANFARFVLYPDRSR